MDTFLTKDGLYLLSYRSEKKRSKRKKLASATLLLSDEAISG